ncbi:MAG: hypothetical protein IJ399_04295 [Bacilli bacterium]|nr:hypothetical protein [Bacilli bacterium]
MNMNKYNKLSVIQNIKNGLYKFILIYFITIIMFCYTETTTILNLNNINELLKLMGYKFLDESIIVMLYSIINILTILLLVYKIFSYDIDNYYEEIFLRIEIKKWYKEKIKIISYILLILNIIKYIIIFLFILKLKYIICMFIAEMILNIIITIIWCKTIYNMKFKQ